MIFVVRRVLFALAIAAGTAGVIRLRRPEASEARRGGWRTLHAPSFR